MVEASVDEFSQHPHVRFHHDHPSTRFENPVPFLECRSGKAQMVEYIHEDDVPDRLISECQRVGVFDLVNPRIGKDIGANTVWDGLSNRRDARSQLQRDPIFLMELFADQRMDVPIRPPEDWFVVPVLLIQVDLGVVLGDIHARP